MFEEYMKINLGNYYIITMIGIILGGIALIINGMFYLKETPSIGALEILFGAGSFICFISTLIISSLEPTAYGITS